MIEPNRTDKRHLGKDKVVSKRFDAGKELLAVRSPHITMGNLWVVNNVEREEYVKYFNLTGYFPLFIIRRCH